MKSDNFIKKRSTIDTNQAQVDEALLRVQKKQKLTVDENKQIFLLKQAIKIDRVDIQNTENDSAAYLKLAVTNYMKTILLEENELNSAHLCRTFSLWFSNKANETVLDVIDSNFKQIPSYKFVLLMPQIATRLTSDTDNFGRIIADIVGA